MITFLYGVPFQDEIYNVFREVKSTDRKCENPKDKSNYTVK